MLFSLTEAADALAAGRLNARDLTDAALARIKDPALDGRTAFIHVDEAGARAAAEAQVLLRQAGYAPSRFAGIPITVKDLFDIEGQVTRAGSRLLGDTQPARRTAPAIARLIAAGFVVLGRTNMTEFAFSGLGVNPHYGTPRSPYDRATGRIAGGSSSGAAVAVADGMGLGGIGTDTGGSCRIPAACCGIVGFKPTQRRISLDGAIPLSPSLDSIGPLARDVAGCEALDAIMAGDPDRPVAARDVASLRLLIAQGPVLDGMDIATERSFDRACHKLSKAGAQLTARDCTSFTSVFHAVRKGGFAAVEAYAWHRDFLAQSHGLYDPRVASRILGGAQIAAADYAQTHWDRARIIPGFAAELADFDAVMLPTIPAQPPKIRDLDDEETYRLTNFALLRNPSLINFLDGCAISLPCHDQGAPPAGLMLAAPGLHDRSLFAIAKAVEAALA